MSNRKTIVFQGDSLTDAGRDKLPNVKNYALGDGYVTMIAGKLTYQYPFLNVVNRGVFGSRIADTYSRWQEDALIIPCNMISILHGVNDVGFGIRLGIGSDAKRFEFIYDRMLFEVKEKNPEMQIVLCQPFILRKDLSGTPYEKEFHNDIYTDWNHWYTEMKRRDEAVRRISEKYYTMYVPMWDDLMLAQERIPVDQLTVDGIHLTAAGNFVIAQSWLKVAEPIIEKWK